MSFSLTSPTFENGKDIPAKYTCEGADISPTLTWTGIPDGTKSLALIVDDPDEPKTEAPKMTYVHWVLYNIPVDGQGLEENIAAVSLPAGTKEGINDWGRNGYGGPCPPIGRHRYFFKLFALDMVLADIEIPTKVQVEQAFAGHIIAQAELVGVYQRSR